MTKQAWRRTWFQVHKWIGLILAILIIPICLTGSALVWHDALDATLNPARHATTGTRMLPLQGYVDAARARLGSDARVAQLVLPDGERDPVTVAVSSATPQRGRGGPPARTMVYLDPPSAAVLDTASNRSGAVRFLHVLHGSLQVPGIGRTIVGAIGVAMMLSALTGLWLWWPTVGRWTRGMRWGRHRNLDSRLHYQFGFWIALPLFVLSLTGAWISFPSFFGAIVGEVPRAGGGERARMMGAQPLSRTARTVDDAVIQSLTQARGGALRRISWPTDRSPDWTVTFEEDGIARDIKVADDTGIAVVAPVRDQPTVARWMRRLHDGTDMGTVWQVIIFLGGLIPAGLAVTGVIMWWRARHWRGELSRKRAAT